MAAHRCGLAFTGHFSPLWMNEAAPQLLYPSDSILEEEVDARGFAKNVSRFYTYVPCLAALLCGAAIRMKASTSHQE